MDGKDTGGQKGGKEKKRVAERAMESRFSFSSQPYRRESPYTAAVCSEEGRMRKEEIEEKRMKQKKKMVQSCARYVDAAVSEGRRRGDGGKGRAIEEGGLNEKKKSHPPPEGARRRCDDRSPRDAAAAKTPRPSRFCWRSPSSPTCSCGLSSSSLNDSMALRYNHDVIIDFAMNDRVTTHVSQTRSI